MIPPAEKPMKFNSPMARRRCAISSSLISIFDEGRCEVAGLALLYVVMECAEENLAQVLPARALTPDEARETLDSVLDVLLTFMEKVSCMGISGR